MWRDLPGNFKSRDSTAASTTARLEPTLSIHLVARYDMKQESAPDPPLATVRVNRDPWSKFWALFAADDIKVKMYPYWANLLFFWENFVFQVCISKRWV